MLPSVATVVLTFLVSKFLGVDTPAWMAGGCLLHCAGVGAGLFWWGWENVDGMAWDGPMSDSLVFGLRHTEE